MLRKLGPAIFSACLCVVLCQQPSVAGNTNCCGDGSCGNGSCEVTCPSCNHVCKLSKETTKDKKHCWNVECKPICIPKIRFPWEKCCPPKCAKVKYVNVLKKHEYECESGNYKWTPECVSCGCGGHDGVCGDGGCDHPATPAEGAAATGPQTFSAPQPPADERTSRSLREGVPPVPLEPVAKRTISD